MARVAVVTGAAEGIGSGIATRLVADGHQVAMLDWQGDKVEKLAAELTAAGGTALPLTVDVSDRASIEAAYATVRETFGPIHIVVANAGISNMVPFVQLDQQTWDRMIAVNLTGVFHTIQAAVTDMIEAKYGRVVTISSSSAQSGAPAMAHYVSSKGGVIGLTKALARELAEHRITVNTIPPTLVDTPMSHREAGQAGGAEQFLAAVSNMVPLGRAGTPADIAGAVSFLVSDDAAYITGQIIGVNGGMYI
ncbi:NAD(P)-dependent dehydrogenase, short-chain alcohol dehydrogenase family [Parafrankia irregularis]|uniref:NAD(P)-dependent dehydrogenase, short-chain alcohol dehydrogenase family n=1 Tax=Parafrankia irregularis TaxID=795642 RepID=A0A0S4QR78_9ACTN|nr:MULTISPECIES: SDR family NAD(P)-dependent oxidoreductase [Parafrankia]MBE3205923.1 SDR family oxidoreductase [Parafrankia sp. CH37]CUU58129.1 NAD(P)-dependent dehydrogenase, short-chain alcohol dehydrogenase family [Parafrankia irregularis]